MTEKFFPRAYGLTDQKDIDALYDDWAKTYDQEVTEGGYETPRRCAQALRSFLPTNKPIVDIGCGTGLSGLALGGIGYTDITGTEINPNMLDQAMKRGIYADLRAANLEDPLPFKVGEFSALVAVGVISAGAGPASLLPKALDKLAPGGFLCLSYNDHTLETPDYVDALSNAIDTKIVDQVFSEYGPHLTALDVGSSVYVLRKL